VRDLLFFAKHLFVAAMVAIVLTANSEAALRTGSERQSGIGLNVMWEKQRKQHTSATAAE
jgi:hypothetical protein